MRCKTPCAAVNPICPKEVVRLRSEGVFERIEIAPAGQQKWHVCLVCARGVFVLGRVGLPVPRTFVSITAARRRAELLGLEIAAVR